MEENNSKPIRKKRKVILISIVLIILYIAYKIASPYIVTPSEIKELNRNIDLPFEFGEEVSEEELKEHGWKYEGADYNIMSYMNAYDDVLLLEGFPDLGDSDKLTTFITDNEEIRVFGIGVNDNIEDARKVLKRFGYGYKEESSYGSCYFRKGKVGISIKYSVVEKTIEGIYIELLSTDWFHNGYYK